MRLTSDSVVFADQRGPHRARRIRPARCVFNQGTTVLDVALRDISPVGARIVGRELTALPKSVELQIPDGSGGYSARPALVVWSNGRAAGLKFIEE